MKAVRLHGAGDLRLHTEPEPIPGPGEAVVRVGAVGICGSDLLWFTTAGIGGTGLEKPLVPGHEFAGTVEDEQGRLIRVAVDPAIPCDQCRLCKEGHPNLCERLRFAGHGMDDGALREKVAWPASCLYPLPEGLDEVDGAMLEPLGVALHATGLGGIQPGDRVGVFGCGSIGLLVVQLARLMGAVQIIATDKLAHRLEAASRFGANPVFPSENGEEVQAIWKATEEKGVDVAFEVAGENSAVETAVACAGPGATVVLVGIPADDSTTFRASTARRKGLTIKLCRRMKHTYPRAIQLVEKGLVDVRSLVTHRFSLEDFKEAFDVAQRREGVKVMILPAE